MPSRVALPCFSTPQGEGPDLYPTVFALWKAPSLIPSFLLKGAEVSHYVLSGADLMLARGAGQYNTGEKEIKN